MSQSDTSFSTTRGAGGSIVVTAASAIYLFKSSKSLLMDVLFKRTKVSSVRKVKTSPALIEEGVNYSESAN